MKRKRRLGKVFSLYDNLIYNEQSKNDSNAGIVKKDNFYIDLRGFYSGKDNVTYVYLLNNLPVEIVNSYHSTIRDVCEGNVRINFITSFEKYSIKWKSATMKSKMRLWKSIEKDLEEVNEYNEYDNVEAVDRITLMKASLKYFTSAIKRRKRKTFKVKTIMFVSGKRGQEFNDTIEKVEDICSNTLGIQTYRVMYDVKRIIENFSPFGVEYNAKVQNSVGFNVVTDEIAARFSTYSQGKVGINGISWGVDIFSRFSIIKKVKSKDDMAENWLITSETGGGKTLLVKYLMGQLLADENINGTVNDVEGNEYTKWAYLLAEDGYDVAIINMAEGQGTFVDSVEIVLTGNKRLDMDNNMFALSRSFTTSFIKILVGDVNDTWVDGIIKTAVSNTYSKRGIRQGDYDTWGKSKGLTYFDVYEEIKKFKPLNEKQKIALDLCITNIGVYLDENGIQRDLLSNSIKLSDVIKSKLIVCSFGMRGKTPEAIDKVQMALMQLSAAAISHLRSIFSKLDGKFNFKIWEEFQRWGHFPGSKETVGVALTGGRKLGDINIVITNRLGELVRDDVMGILEAVSSYAIGGINSDSVIEEFCRIKNIETFKPVLEQIAKENRDSSDYETGDVSEKSPYLYSFLMCLDKVKYTVGRVEMPTWLLKSDLFKSGLKQGDVYYDEEVR